MTAAEKWRADLASWAIPEEIRVQAPQDPWIHPVAQFIAPDVIPDSPAHQVARAALPEGGSVLDVGCGGGRAALALVPPASRWHRLHPAPHQRFPDVLAHAPVHLAV